MNADIGPIRSNAMRALYLLTLIGLGPSVFSELFSPSEPWEAYYGVAMSVWAAFSLLAILGILYPMRMVVLLLMQFCYKLIWVLGVGLPMWFDGTLEGSARELAMANGIGVLLDALIIPWLYLFRHGMGKPVLGRRQPTPVVRS